MHLNDSILPRSSYVLNKLDFEDVGSYNDQSVVPLATSLCPFVTKICMYGIVDLTDSDLLCLRSLERLNVLEMSSCGKSVGISFDGGLVPLFKAIGPQLKALDLEPSRSIQPEVFNPKITTIYTYVGFNYHCRRSRST